MSALNRTLLLAGIAMVVIAALLAIDPVASFTWHPTLTMAAATIAPAVERLDILIGARQIADFTGLSENQVYHQTKIGVLPVTRQGSLLIGSKSRLRQHFSAQVEQVSAEVGA
jgi:hypothetical protein